LYTLELVVCVVFVAVGIVRFGFFVWLSIIEGPGWLNELDSCRARVAQ